MKYIIITVIVLGAILGGVALKPNTTVWQAPEVVEKLVEKEVPTLEKRVADAIAASSTDIEREAQAAYVNKKAQLENAVESRVTTEYRKEIEARELELEQKEMSF